MRAGLGTSLAFAIMNFVGFSGALKSCFLPLHIGISLDTWKNQIYCRC